MISGYCSATNWFVLFAEDDEEISTADAKRGKKRARGQESEEKEKALHSYQQALFSTIQKLSQDESLHQMGKTR